MFHCHIQLFDDIRFIRYGFLTSRFKPELYFWEVILLVRLCLLIAVLVVLDEPGSVPVQTMAGITVLFIAEIAHSSNKVCI